MPDPIPPTVTVLIAVHNGGRYLSAAVESVLSQTFADFELLAMDDGSTDGSGDVLRRCAAADPRVRVVSGPNRGLTVTLNDGIGLARGRYVARMDADDLCLPRRLELQVAYLEAHPECVLVGGQVEWIDPHGWPIRPMPKLWLDHEQIDGGLLRREWPLVHPAVTMRTDALRAAGGYDPRYKTNQDHDLFLRLAERGRLANLPDPVLRYRQHFKSVSLSKGSEQTAVVGRILADAYARRGLTMPDDLRNWTTGARSERQHYTGWFWQALAAGNVATARRHAVQILRRAPLSLDSYRIAYCAARGR